MKKLILTLKRIFSKQKVNGTSETQSTYIDGDFVKLVWMIEKLRHPSNKCTMNELIKEANKHFDGLKGIKEVTNEKGINIYFSRNLQLSVKQI